MDEVCLAIQANCEPRKFALELMEVEEESQSISRLTKACQYELFFDGQLEPIMELLADADLSFENHKGKIIDPRLALLKFEQEADHISLLGDNSEKVLNISGLKDRLRRLSGQTCTAIIRRHLLDGDGNIL